MTLTEKTQGVKRGINDQLNALERKAYQAGYEDGQKEVRAEAKELTEDRKAELRGEGVCMLADSILSIYEIECRKAKLYTHDYRAIAAYEVFRELQDLCPIEFIDKVDEIWEKEQAKAEEKSKPYEPKVGDTVLDKSGNECKVMNTDTHVHVLYPNGKTHKWDKSDRFTFVERHEWIK